MKLNIIILLLLLCFGLLIVPLGLFAINDFIFGKYSGDGFVGFYDGHFLNFVLLLVHIFQHSE